MVVYLGPSFLNDGVKIARGIPFSWIFILVPTTCLLETYFSSRPGNTKMKKTCICNVFASKNLKSKDREC